MGTGFGDLLGGFEKTVEQTLTRRSKNPKKTSAKDSGRGCSVCPLNNTGATKILGIDRLRGKDLFIWSQSPGGQDNQAGLELLGAPGKFLWQELARVGITREDCDIQNVVRCRPTQLNEFDSAVDRAPTKEEVHCCSIYTEQALTRSQAKVHLVFGAVAAKALLGSEFRKGQKTFWSNKLNGHVVTTYHPTYFLRGAPRSKMEEFRKALESAAEKLSIGGGQFDYLRKQRYQRVLTKDLPELEAKIREASGRGIRISTDIETGKLNDQAVITCIGFCIEKGVTDVVFLDHADLEGRIKRDLVIAFFRRILEDATIEKTFHYGSSDCLGLSDILDIRVKGFYYDTQYAEYMRDTNRKAFGLAAIADSRFQMFAGYKTILNPYKDENGHANMSRVPIAILLLYNGADCDLGKRIENTTWKKANLSLMKAMVYASFVLKRMEMNGPIFDYKHLAFLETYIPAKLENTRVELRKWAKDPEYNPRSPPQTSAIIYDVLKLGRLLPKGYLAGKKSMRTTDAETVELLCDRHPFARLLKDFRYFDKIESTYMHSYKLSADLHNGRLATKWWLTGASTGRMSSGGSKEEKEEDAEKKGIVNLQNIHGDASVECLLVSDLRWRSLYRDWLRGIPCEELVKKYGDLLEVFLAMDHSQLEIRILAQLSRDPLLLKLLNNAADIHSQVGNQLTGKPVEEVINDRDLRTFVKSLHFAIIFGKGPKGLHQALSTIRFDEGTPNETVGVKSSRNFKPDGTPEIISFEEVEELYNAYFTKFRGVRDFMNGCIAQVESEGFIQTAFGLIREIFAGVDSESGRTSFWKNMALNTPVQGTAHQLMIIALAVLHLKPKTFGILQNIIMEIHDAADFSVKLNQLPEAYKSAKFLLVDTVLEYVHKWWPELNWVTPLVTDAKAGFRFGCLVKYKGQTPVAFIEEWCQANKKLEESFEKEKIKALKKVVEKCHYLNGR